jgi:hypothetical protein
VKQARSIGALVLVLAVLVAVGASCSSATADTGSISRDSRGTSTYGTADPLGGPPTPRVYGFGQTTIFVAGIALLALAALLGLYTFITERRAHPRR